MKRARAWSVDDEGASLVEIMVALFILGVSASLVVLNLPDRSTDARSTSLYLKTMVEVTRDRALASGSPYGLVLTPANAEIVIWREGRWSKATVAASGLPETPDMDMLEMTRVGSAPVNLAMRERDRAQTEQRLIPDVWFDPSGIASEADLQISGDRGTARFRVARSGEVVIETSD